MNNNGNSNGNSNPGSNIVSDTANKIYKAKDDNSGLTSRQKVDNAIDSTGSEALQKMGVPKKVSDKAVKNNGGKFNPANLPFGKLAKNKSRDALAKGLDSLGGKNNNPSHNQNPGNQNNGRNNFGKRLLNGMSNRARPEQNPADQRRQKQIERAIKVAKHIPIPQVKAAAQAADKLSKSKLGKRLMNKGGLLGGDKGGSASIVGMIGKQKLIMFAAPLLFLIIIASSLIASVSTSASESGQEMNEATCMLEDGAVEDECQEASEEAEDFHDRVKEIQKQYESDGKKFNNIYIAGFYSVISNFDGAKDINYNYMTKDKIMKIADAMFIESDNTYTFSDDEWKENLKNDILPKYIPNKSSSTYEEVIEKIYDYIDRYKSTYNLTDDNQATATDTCIGPVTNVTTAELCNLHRQNKVEEWIEKFGPIAQQDYSRTGIFASVTIAQGILETGWGCSHIGNNMFGIKCGGFATCTNTYTHENYGGVNVGLVDSFRIYKNIGESVYDHSKLLTNSHYTSCGVSSAKDPFAQLAGIKKCGYATDPNYVTSNTNLIKEYNLTRFDVKVLTADNASCTSAGESMSGWSLRTVAPNANNKAFTYKNSNRGQCVWYAQARAIEIAEDLASKGKITETQAANIRSKLLSIYGNGGEWYVNSKGKFKGSNNINNVKSGSIISWTQPGSYGHVALIEEATDKEVIVTEGWANHTQSCPNDWSCINFRQKKMSRSQFLNSYGKYYNGGYLFSGYIYFLEPES